MTSHDLDDALVEELIGSTGLLLRRLRAESNPDALTWSQTIVMGRLERHGPATTADLARAEGVKPQSMGATLAGLERDGLVTRTAHETDGRQFLFALSPQGRAARAEHRLMKRRWLEDAMSRLSPQELDTLAAATTVIQRLARE